MPTRGDSTSNASGAGIYAVTKSDGTNDPNGPFRGLVFGGAGAIKLTMADGTAVTLPSGLLATNQIHALRFKRVWSTGTAATDIYGVT